MELEALEYCATVEIFSDYGNHVVVGGGTAFAPNHAYGLVTFVHPVFACGVCAWIEGAIPGATVGSARRPPAREASRRR